MQLKSHPLSKIEPKLLYQIKLQSHELSKQKAFTITLVINPMAKTLKNLFKRGLGRFL